MSSSSLQSSANQESANSKHWASYAGFMLACIGAAVGLGNIWKFPYLVGSNGGSAFVLIYLATIASIAIPIAAAEIVLGRMGQSGPVGSLRKVAAQEGRPTWLAIGGDVGVLASYILLTFYAVISGWVLSYIYRALTTGFIYLDNVKSTALFDELLARPTEMISMQILFLVAVALVLTRGISAGLERANLIMMPALFVMLIIVALYGALVGAPGAAIDYLFTPDFSKIDSSTVLAAVGQGFFSVGVGSAILITYGAYMDHSIKIGTAALTIGLADTFIALLAGFGIFAIVFAQNLDPAAGPGLIFITLPVAFSGMPAGHILGVVFFVLVLFAAFSSAIALAEVIISWAEERLHISRRRASWLMLTSNFLIGLLTVFSFNVLSDFRLGATGVLAEKNLFELKDYISASILMPVSGLLVVLFASWGVRRDHLLKIFGDREWVFTIWLWLGRLVAPLGILWVFWANL